MARVFVTQVPNRRDRATGAFVPAFNIAPADAFGEVVIMMPSNAPFYGTEELTAQLREYLEGYSFAAGDSLVAGGDPSIIAVACAILGRLHGRFTLLKWDRMDSRYIPTTIDVVSN